MLQIFLFCSAFLKNNLLNIYQYTINEYIEDIKDQVSHCWRMDLKYEEKENKIYPVAFELIEGIRTHAF